MRAAGRLFVLGSVLFAGSVAGCGSQGDLPGTSPDTGPGPSAAPRSAPRAEPSPAPAIATLQRHASFAGTLGRGGALESIGGALRARGVDEAVVGLRARLPSTSGGSLRLESGKDARAWAAIRAVDLADVTGSMDEGAIVFHEAARDLPGVDVVLATDGARAEELRLHRAPSASIDARWRVDVGPAITTVRAREGRFELVDRGGYVHLQTAPIVALDDDDRALPVTIDVAPAGPSAYALHVHVDTASARFPVALDPAWTAIAPMATARRFHLATTLDNGRVLVVGGAAANSTAELYDPVANTWSSAGAVDPTTLNGRIQGLFTTNNHQALLVGSDVCTTTKLACGKLSGRTCVQIQHFTGGTTWKPVAKIGPLPDSGAIVQLPGAKLMMVGKADDCAANQGYVGATFDESGVTYLPTAKIFAWDPTLGIAADAAGRVFFPVKGAPSWWLDSTSGAWTQGPPAPTQGTITLDLRGVLPMATGQIFGIFTGSASSVAAVLPSGGNAWSTPFACEVDLHLADIGTREGRNMPRVAFGDDGSAVGVIQADFYRTTATGCTHLRYPTNGVFLPDGTAATLSDGRMVISGGAQLPGTSAIISTAGLANGAACKDPALCGSGLCVGGVCCDQPCTGTCMSCRASDTGVAEGTCAPRANGVRDTRCTDAYSPALAAKTYTGICALADGTCDGAGACRTKALANRSCGTSSCIGDQLNGPKCDGAGNCQAVSTKPCDPFTCDATAGACKASCTTSADCTATSYCGTDGTCAPKKANGHACAADAECSSSACVDSYCCSAPCSGQCQACDVTGHEGSCWPVDGAPHGTRTACDGSGPCGGACKGATSTTECTYPGATTDCGTTCESGSYTEKTCDAHGACVSKAPLNCGAYKCDGGSPARCLQSCAGNDACATGYVCKGGSCIPEPKPTCSADGTQSVSGLGAITPCGAYRCDDAAGTCRTTCASSDECGAGFICDGARTCAAAPAPTATDSGGCATGARPASGSTFALGLALGAAALIRARRRR